VMSQDNDDKNELLLYAARVAWAARVRDNARVLESLLDDTVIDVPTPLVDDDEK
jgi:hypothetical protein